MKQKRYLLISLLIFCLFVTLQWGYANTTISVSYTHLTLPTICSV